MRATASARAAASFTIPPLESLSRPTSNCGLTSATRRAPGAAWSSTAGSTCSSEMKETSMVTMPAGGSAPEATSRMSVASSETTLGSARRRA